MTEKEDLERRIIEVFDNVIADTISANDSDTSGVLLGLVIGLTIANAAKTFKENFRSKRFKSNLSITEIETMIDDISERTRKKYLE